MTDYNFIPERSSVSYRKSDTSFIISVILMWGVGIFTLLFCSTNYARATYDNSFYFFNHQLIASFVGFAGLLFFAIFPLNKMRKLLPVMCIASIVLCILTFVPGIRYERNDGAHRWIRMPFFTFQPSEVLKFTIILFLANFFDKYSRKEDGADDKNMTPAVLGLVISVAIVMKQKDFSTSMFIMCLGLFMFFIAKAKLIKFIAFSPLIIAGIVLGALTENYRSRRIAAFLNPQAYPESFNFQVNSSKKAISAGGFWGQGIGDGLKKLNSIPEIQSDYIFAGWSEAMGFIGVVIYLVLLILFTYKAVRIALKCPDRFSAFASLGCAAAIFFQSVVNIGVVVGILPSTGIPLPFFSSGGSSIIVTLCMCGFIINASKCDSDTLYYEKSASQDSSAANYENLDVSFFTGRNVE